MREMSKASRGQDYRFEHILDRAVEQTPDKTAIYCREDSITYSQLDNNSNRAANLIRRFAARYGHVGIISVNCIDYFEIMLGCARNGVTAVNINWRLSPRELVNLLEFNDCSLAFVQIENEAWEEELKRLLSGRIPLIHMTSRKGEPSEYDQLLSRESSQFTAVDTEEDDILMHVHTSGTTGTPKCVMHSHKSFISEMVLCRENMGFSQNEVYQAMCQMFHVASIGPYMELMSGGTTILIRNFDPDAYLASVEQYRVNRIGTIPTVLKALCLAGEKRKYCLDSVKVVSYSTCPASRSVLERAMEMFPNCEFIQSYGMTEMGSVVTVLDGQEHRREEHRSSVGRCIPGFAIKIVDEEGRSLPAGAIGEIHIQGPSLLKGYYKCPKLYEEHVYEGWLRSGDLGYLDEEGYLYLEGRKNHMIISGGENIYPQEIEDRIMEISGDILEAAVFGIPDEH